MPNQTLADIISIGQAIENHRPWPRAVIDTQTWKTVAGQLAASQWILSGLWGDAGAVHMALLDEAAAGMAVVTLPCPAGQFPPVGQGHPPAIRLERTIHDLFGIEPDSAP